MSKPSKASLRRQLSSGSAGLDEVISCSAGLRDLDQGSFGKLISAALEVHPDIQADAARLSRTVIVAAPWLSIVSMKYSSAQLRACAELEQLKGAVHTCSILSDPLGCHHMASCLQEQFPLPDPRPSDLKGFCRTMGTCGWFPL